MTTTPSASHITKEALKELLSIGDSSVHNYLRDGLLSVDSNCLFSRKAVYKALGINPATDEPLIGIEEVGKMTGLKPSRVVGLCNRTGVFPFYSFRLGKGAKCYFLRSEVEAGLASRFKWDNKFPNFQARKYFMAEIYDKLISITPDLSAFQTLALRAVHVEGNTMDGIVAVSGRDTTPGAVANTLAAGMEKIKDFVGEMSQQVAGAQGLMEEIDRLRAENNILRNEITRGQYEIPSLPSQLSIGEKITNYDLPGRLLSVMATHGLFTLSDLTTVKRSFLANHQNIGVRSMKLADALLSQAGLTWLPEKAERKKTMEMLKAGYDKHIAPGKESTETQTNTTI